MRDPLREARAGAGVNSAEERELSWGERAGRANNRFGQFLVADEFRSLRRFYFGAWVATLGSGGLGLLLLFIAGRTDPCPGSVSPCAHAGAIAGAEGGSTMKSFLWLLVMVAYALIVLI